MRFRPNLLPAFLLLLASGEAAAQFQLSVPDPVAGQPVTVTLPGPADVLVVTYRPNSSIADRDTLATGGAQTVAWTPARAGVAALSVPGGPSQNVSIRFRAAPASGIFVLILAGTILFGGALFAFRKLFEEAP